VEGKSRTLPTNQGRVAHLVRVKDGKEGGREKELTINKWGEQALGLECLGLEGGGLEIREGGFLKETSANTKKICSLGKR